MTALYHSNFSKYFCTWLFTCLGAPHSAEDFCQLYSVRKLPVPESRCSKHRYFSPSGICSNNCSEIDHGCLYASGYGFSGSFVCFGEGSVITSYSSCSWSGGHHKLYNIKTWCLIKKFFPVRSACLEGLQQENLQVLLYTSWSNQAFGSQYCAIHEFGMS